MAVVSVQACTQWTESSGAVTCTQLEWVPAYLLPPSAEGYLTLLMGGFDASAFRIGFASAIGVFAIGFGVGVVLSIMRKARS